MNTVPPCVSTSEPGSMGVGVRTVVPGCRRRSAGGSETLAAAVRESALRAIKGYWSMIGVSVVEAGTKGV